MPSIDLYLAVLPLIHISDIPFVGFGLTEQTLTLFPVREFATEFFPEEVDVYIDAFRNREKRLTGGHVTGYQCFKEPTDDGRRVIVRVVQNVT